MHRTLTIVAATRLRHVWLVWVLVLDACATARRHAPPPPPYVLVIPVALDSARILVRSALQHEALVVDGTPAIDRDVLVTTFLVRRGGMGEAEIRLRLQLSSDAASTAEGGATLRLEGTVRDLARRLLMSAEDARSSRFSREPHPIQDNDRESLQRISRLLDRLQQLGWTRTPAR